MLERKPKQLPDTMVQRFMGSASILMRLCVMSFLAALMPAFAAPAVPLRNAPYLNMYDAMRDNNNDGRLDLGGKSIVVRGVLTTRPVRPPPTNEIWLGY